jgi:hypothetical protein
VLELWGPNRAVGFESTVSRGVKLPWVLFTRWLEIALIPEVWGVVVPCSGWRGLLVALVFRV